MNVQHNTAVIVSGMVKYIKVLSSLQLLKRLWCDHIYCNFYAHSGLNPWHDPSPNAVFSFILKNCA